MHTICKHCTQLGDGGVAAAAAAGVGLADSTTADTDTDDVLLPKFSFETELDVAGIGRAKGGVAGKKQDAKELACQAWLTKYIGKRTMVRDGWIVIVLDSDETARAIGEEIMYLGKTVGNWRQVCICVYTLITL